MANSDCSSLLASAAMEAMLFLAILMMTTLHVAEAQVGVCYGMDGDNLPSAAEVVSLYNQYDIRRMRIYRPEPKALQALSGSNIEVMVGIPNTDLQRLANSQTEADAWVQNNILNYKNVKFRYIGVGNEAHDDNSAAQYLVPAMMKIQVAIKNAGLDAQIKISSSISFGVIGNSFPPSEGSFLTKFSAFINPLIDFLAENQAPLMVNLYPYFAYIDPNSHISEDYLLFRAQPNQYGYTNLFDAQLDAVYAALEKVNVQLANSKVGSNKLAKSKSSLDKAVITESGYPSKGGRATSLELAQAYNANLMQHVNSGRGTPKRPNEPMEVYLFSMFDENLKPNSYGALSVFDEKLQQSNDGIEGAWGIFYPNEQPKYSLPKFNPGTHVGVSYGMDGDNLPSPQDVVNLYNQYGIKKMRIYRPEPRALQALSGSDIELIVGILNDELQHFANSQADANAWVQNNILNFKNVKFRYIVVGNEADVNSSVAPYLVPAMMKFRDALKNAGLDNQIKISSAIRFSVLDKSYPPSAGSFRPDLTGFVDPLMNFLVENNAPLMVNIYPYFAYADNPSSISIDYALFRSQSVVVQDGSNGYTNLFDAQLDAVYAALEKINVASGSARSIQVIVSESGWPSRGGQATTIENAATYYSKLVQHTKSGGGTPRRPNVPIEVYLFSMFDEDLKPGSDGIEGAWGLFYPNKQPKYSITF